MHVYVKVVVPAGKVVTSPLGSVDVLDSYKSVLRRSFRQDTRTVSYQGNFSPTHVYIDYYL